MSVTIDDSDYQAKSKTFIQALKKAVAKGVDEVAHEVLRLSTFEVPHDTGMLQTSGHVEPGNGDTEKIVGYNKVYAARLHEHPEYRFQKGRKGKYLEDPIKNNLKTFITWIQESISKIK